MEENEINLYDFWIVIKKNLRLIIGLCIILILAAMIVGLLIPKTYKATASILPPMETSNMADLSSLMGVAGIKGITPQTSTSDIFIAILKSRTMLDEIINKFNLQQVYRCKTKQDARKVLAKKTEITLSKERVIGVSIIDTNPERSAAMANYYITTLDRLNRNLNITTAGQMRRFIEQRLEETKQALNNAEEKLKLYQVSHKILAGKNVEETAKTAGELQGRLMAATVELEATKKYTTLQNPDLIKLQNEVIELEKALTSLPPLETELARLIRELKSQETVYALLLSQYEQAKINEAKDTPTVQVLDWATVPEKKYKPNIRFNMAISGIIALFLGIFIAFVRESFQRRNIKANKSL